MDDMQAEAVLAELKAIRQLVAAETPDVAYGGSPNTRVLQNYPADGMSRVSINAHTRGGVLNVGVGPVPTDVMPANPARAGFSLINSGAYPCYVYLVKSGQADGGAAASQGAGVGMGYLTAGGGSWDGKLSDVLWCGAVSLLAIGGASAVVFAEI